MTSLADSPAPNTSRSGVGQVYIRDQGRRRCSCLVKIHLDALANLASNGGALSFENLHHFRPHVIREGTQLILARLLIFRQTRNRSPDPQLDECRNDGRFVIRRKDRRDFGKNIGFLGQIAHSEDFLSCP